MGGFTARPPVTAAVPGHGAGTATAESRWHLGQVWAAVCLVPAPLEPSITRWLV